MKNEKNAAPVIIDWLGLLQGNELGAYNRREMLDALNDYRIRISGRRGDARSRNIDRALTVKGSNVRRAVADLLRYSPRPNTCGAFACGADLCAGCANPTRQPIASGLSVSETLDGLRDMRAAILAGYAIPALLASGLSSGKILDAAINALENQK